jgi:multiple sugar transport system substrate-binding protein
MKRWITAALGLLLSAGIARADTEITYQFWGSPQEVEVWNRIARSFEASHQGVKVKVEASDWDSYWEKLKVKMAGGTPPDVFAMDAPLFKDWQSRGVLLNLKPYIDKTPGIFDGVYPVTLKAYQTPDGMYGLPRDFQTIVLYYNKDMFDTAHIAYPTDAWTWDDLRKAARTLTLDKNGDGVTDQWGFWDEGYDMEPLWGALLWSYGGEVVDPESGKTLIGSPQSTAALSFLTDMWLKDKSMPTEQQLKQFGTDGFFAGVAAMGVSGHWTVPDYIQASFKWAVAPLPKGPAGRVTSVNSAGFVIAKDSKHPDEAWEFVKYAFSDKGQAELAAIGLAVPVRKSVAESPAYLDQAARIDQALYVKALDYARVKPGFKGYEEWSSAVGDALHSIWSGEADFADGLAEAVANGDDALARNK